MIHALKLFPEDICISIDDDQFYKKNMISLLLDSYSRFPQYIHAHAVYKYERIEKYTKHAPFFVQNIQENVPALGMIPLGVGGVLYPPHALHEEVFNEKVFCEIAPLGDDLWFWAMSVKNNTKKVLAKRHLAHSYCFTNNHQKGTHLCRINADKNYNATQLVAIFECYPEILDDLEMAKDSKASAFK